MPITRRATVGLASTASNFGVAETSGSPQVGDERYVLVHTSGAATITPPSGWATLYDNTFGSAARIGLFSRTYAAGSGTETFTFNGTAHFAMAVSAVTGRNPDVAPQVAVASNAAATSMVAPTLTPGNADGLLMVWFVVSRNSGASTATMTTPTGLTRFGGWNPSGAVGYPHVVFGTDITDAATTTAYTSTQDASNSYRSVAVYIPAAGAPAANIPTAPTGAVRANAMMTAW